VKVSASINQGLLWLAVAVASYALLVYIAGKSVYYPMRFPAGDWSVQSTLAAEDVWLHARDGTKLHGWWISRPGSNWATLHLHGNAGNITHRDLSAETIIRAGSSVLLLDYRGYGKSEGRPTEAGVYLDAAAAYEWLIAKGYKAGQIILHGESLGTAIAVELATRKACAGVVLEAPFTSARAMAHRVLPFVGPLLVWGFGTVTRVKSVSAPVFVIHGARDNIVAYQFGKEVFDAAPEPKRLWTVEKAGHNDLHIAAQGEFAERLAGFYASL
jgi:fermentation-respiration switch protein FrsA (DUF1100 family)